MKNFLLLILIIPHCVFSQQKIDKDYFEQLLSAGQFEKVFLECNTLLQAPYGKTSALTYYYLGRSLCGKGYVNQGREWYKYLKEKLPVEKKFQDEITQAELNCNLPAAAGLPRVVNVIINASYTPSQPGGIRGKGGFTLGCKKDVNENYDKLRQNDSLDKRLFGTNEKEAAIKKLRSFLPEKYRIDTSGRFLVVSLSSQSYYQQDVRKVVDKLEFAYKFYVTHFKLSETDKLFTVYLLPYRHSLQDAAKDVHDIKLSKANIGYSSLNDLSLLGIAKPNAVGTLFHELFHLVVRADIGDISPWLDEGMACLYSVYTIENGAMEGDDDTWRVMHFKLLMNLKSTDRVTVPSLEQLINFNWKDYQGGTEENLCIASVHYALSNMLVLYFQEKKILPAVIDAFKNRRQLGMDSLLPGPNDTRLLEIILQKKFDVITAEFYEWLQAKYNISMYSLLKQRPSYTLNDLPASLQASFDSSFAMLNAIEQDPLLNDKATVKLLKEENDKLFAQISSLQRSLINWQNDMLQDLAGSDMQSTVHGSEPNWYENEMSMKAREHAVFNSKLRRLLKIPSP